MYRKISFVFHYQVVICVYSAYAVVPSLETGISEDQRVGNSKWTCVIGDKNEVNANNENG
jgi:hypothetical protein